MKDTSIWTLHISARQARNVGRALREAGYTITNEQVREKGYAINISEYLEPGDVSARNEVNRIIAEAAGHQPKRSVTRLIQEATTMTYDEAFTMLCTGRAHPEWDERHHEARETVARAVWAVATEEGDGYGEMFDWIATGDFSPADLERRTAFTAAALAAEWDGMQRDARNA